MKIAEKLVTIAENQEKVFNAGGLNYSPKETTSGEVISITDISPIEHNMGVKVSSKNIIDFFNTSLIQDVTYITTEGVNRTTKGYVVENLEAGKSYTVSFSFKDNSDIDTYVYSFLRDKTTLEARTGTQLTTDTIRNNPYTFVAQENCDFVIYRGGSYIINKTDVDKFSEFQIEKGTATPYTPFVGDVSTTTLKAQGKNLFKPTNYTKGTLDAGTGDAGEAATVKPFTLTTDFIYLKSGAYVVSNIVGANLRYIAFYDLNKGFKSATWTAREKTFKFTITEDCYVRIDIERDANVKIDNFDTFCDEYQFMLEVGTTKTKYEKYIEPTTYTPNEDGTVDNVKSIYPSMTLSTDTQGVLIECEYYQNAIKLKQNLTDAILSLGGVLNV